MRKSLERGMRAIESDGLRIRTSRFFRKADQANQLRVCEPPPAFDPPVVAQHQHKTRPWFRPPIPPSIGPAPAHHSYSAAGNEPARSGPSPFAGSTPSVTIRSLGTAPALAESLPRFALVPCPLASATRSRSFKTGSSDAYVLRNSRTTARERLCRITTSWLVANCRLSAHALLR
jgi:hypothetical protein